MIDQEIQKVEMKVENAREVGREIEHGRRDVLHSANMELASEVKKLLDFLVRLNNMTSELEKKKEELSSVQGTKVWLWLMVFIAIPVGIIAFLAEHWIVGGVAFLCFLGIFASPQSESEPKLIEDVKKLESRIERIKQKMDNIDWSVIPPDYRNEQAMNFIYQALVNQRAMTMQEAVNLYEDELHKGRLETLQKINAQATLLNAEATMLNNF